MSFSTRRTMRSFGDPGTAAAISFTINSQFPIFRGEPMMPSRFFISVPDSLRRRRSDMIRKIPFPWAAAVDERLQDRPLG